MKGAYFSLRAGTGEMRRWCLEPTKQSGLAARAEAGLVGIEPGVEGQDPCARADVVGKDGGGNGMKSALRSSLPSPVWDRMKRSKRRVSRILRRTCELAGLNIARARDYYSPLPLESRIRKNVSRWYAPTELLGIDYDLTVFRALTSSLLGKFYPEFAELPDYTQVIEKGFGPGYTAVDALTLYGMLRERKPGRYLEVGSGVSTYYASLAASKNQGQGHPMRIECIEPYPYKSLYDIPGIVVHREEVQSVGQDFFHRLGEGDVLFIDSSHVLKIDGDVPHLYLNVLPALNPGVLIHVHDIPFPFNVPYPAEKWVLGDEWPMYWNEAMLLQAFLCFNRNFEVVLSLPLLRHFDEGFLREVVPIYQSIREEPNTFSSIWLRKLA
jgi:Methyltransferase domain